MPDISSTATPLDNTISTNLIGTTAVASLSVIVGVDTLLDPRTGSAVLGNAVGTADISAMIERAVIALFDNFGDNLR